MNTTQRLGLAMLGGVLLATFGFARAPTLAAHFDPLTRQVAISVTAVDPAEWELRVETPSLSQGETGAEVNEPGIIYLPPWTTPPETPPQAGENIFFFNSLRAADGWELVVEFEDEVTRTGTWKLNGRFSPQGGAVAGPIVLPWGELEPDENLLHLRPVRTRPRLALRHPVPASGRVGFTVRRSDWSGTVRLIPRRRDAGDIPPAIRLAGPALPSFAHAIPVAWWEDRAAVAAAALAAGRFALAAQVKEAHSFFHGGFNLVYDPRQRSHRMPHWIWSWGPTISLLLDLASRPEARAAGMHEGLRTAALTAAERSLAFEERDPAHPAHGISTVRWESSREAANGWVEYLSTADSLFLAGWGWLPAYAATGQATYLERTRSLLAATERLMQQHPVVPQDWVVARERWTPHTLDESVFGMIAFRALHDLTGEDAVAAQGKRFLDSHLHVMTRGDGLLERAWLHAERQAMWDPDIKGHAWVIEGYLDAYRLRGDTRYLELARALAQRVLAGQRDDGSWSYNFGSADRAAPPDDKGTAIWSYMLYELGKHTRDPAHLAAARRAVAWCLHRQQRGPDPDLDGGLLNENQMAYVRRRPMVILYSTTFLGLALLEELKLADSTAGAPP